MFFLVTGASGVGKSRVRRALERDLRDLGIDGVELSDVAAVPEIPDLAWRQRATEQVVRYALERQRAGRHVLLASDPVAPGELLAAPAADLLDAIAICLLDCEPAAQRARLRARSEPEEMLPRHVAFADWMRRHVSDPTHLPEVIAAGGWPEMRWK